MRKSIVLVSLVSIVCALFAFSTGCVPNASRGPVQADPHSYDDVRGGR
jgi:hypothetical protein